jgi:UDPglucose--hexose-1-phosphate uridylyltransferase
LRRWLALATLLHGRVCCGLPASSVDARLVPADDPESRRCASVDSPRNPGRTVIELRSSSYDNEIVLPDGTRRRLTVDARIDPFTGHVAHLISGPAMLPDSDADLDELAATSRDTCPFCPERIDKVTATLPPEIWPGGRIRVGDAVLFANLVPYARHAVVTVYSPSRHMLRVGELSEGLIADNLRAQVTFLRAVRAGDPEARWMSINANHLAPSGSSIFHPHTQGICHPDPSPAQRKCDAIPAEVILDLVHTERALGSRWLADTGRVCWMSAFAPVGPGDVRGYLPSLRSPAQLDDDLCDELAHGLAAVFRSYAGMGVTSFNLAIYGVPEHTAGGSLSVQLVCRSGISAYYRSDVTFLERLHCLTVTGLSPEHFAEQAGPQF